MPQALDEWKDNVSTLPPTEIAYRVLRVEQQLESYERLHAQELEEIRQLLAELKIQVLGLQAGKDPNGNLDANVLPPTNS